MCALCPAKTHRIWFGITVSAIIFWLSAALLGGSGKRDEMASSVVLPAFVQVVIYGGDRYLASNIEYVRGAMSGGEIRQDEAVFRARVHQEVSALNPCHADNYWVGNAELTWGGGQSEGAEILDRAMRCRFWDEWPAFFLAFNRHFFGRDAQGARSALEIAAQRADEKNAAAYRNLAVMLVANELKDSMLALELVRKERDSATDIRLRRLLDQRVGRLEGLVILRRAKQDFEAALSRPLQQAEELLDAGYLKAFPVDPLGLGYEFRDGEFYLRRLRHEGLESLR